MRRAAFWVWLALAACSGAGAGSEGRPATATGPATPVAAAPAPPTPEAVAGAEEASVWLSPPGRDPVRVYVEVARTVEERRRGLMEREHLAADHGMLFLFERPEPLTFWMRNTFIPLDMIFITSDMTILGIVENAEPQTDDPRSVPGLSQYVLEVNAGYSRSQGLGTGTAVRFDGVALGEGGP